MPSPAVTQRYGWQHQLLVGSPDFVGRDRELAALTAALASPPAVLLIEGEAGIGKTRLVQEYLTGTGPASAGAAALVACCPPYQRPHTLGPVADALRQAAGQVRDLKLTGLAGALRPLFPEWAQDLPPAPEPAEDATAARHRLFRALADVIGGLGITLVVVEDAHWADEATLEFLLFLASRPRGSGGAGQPAPVSLVITFRPEDVPHGSLLPRLARLAAGTSGLRLALTPLTVAATAGLVSSMLTGERLSAEFAGFMHEHTGGVPLAVEESVRLMAARADLTRRGGQWVRRELVRLAVPPPVRDAVLERVARLAPDAQAVLWAAAVTGEPAAEARLAALTGLAHGRVRAGLAQTLDCGLLASAGGGGLVAFRHPLSCQAVYEAIPAPERCRLHQRAGETLETVSPPPLAALARHFREAADLVRWLRYGEQAADLALAAGDEATAAATLHDLITGGGLAPRDVARLASKIILLALPGDQLPGLAAALRAALAGAGLTPGLEAELRFQLGRLLTTMNELDSARPELERAVAGLPAGSAQATRAMMLLGWPQSSTCHADEHLRWVRRAADAAQAGPVADRLRLRIDRASALLQLGEPAGWAEVASLPWDVPAAGEKLQVTRAHLNVGEAAMAWGRYADARRRLEQAVQLAVRFHYAVLRDTSLTTVAHLDWLTGAWPGLAGRVAALAGDENLQGLTSLEAELVTGLLAATAGDAGRAAQTLGNVVAQASRRGAVQYVMEPAAALARQHLASGDVAAALDVTEDPIAMVARKGVWLWAADLAPARVAALAMAGRLDEAAALTGALAGGLRGRDIPAARAGLALCRAHLAEGRGDPARAAALFAAVAAAWQQLPRPYEALLARERQARCLLAAGRDEAAVAVLGPAADGLRELGAHADGARVARTLKEHGVTRQAPRGRGRPSYGDELSPRELEVVQMVAAGRTNREIAEALVLSRQTVASHVHSALRKLRVSSRTALAVSAAQAGILGGAGDEKNPGPVAAQ
jgi:DNA-binding CsgD family transcriptional regulator